MTILNTILQRKSQPRIDGDMVDEDFETILKCALTAPDHKALRPWRYIICPPQSKSQLKDMIFEASLALYAHNAGITLGDISEEHRAEVEGKITQKLAYAPYIIISALEFDVGVEIPDIELILSAGAAIQNMIVAAESLNYSCYWRTGEWAYNPFLVRALGLESSVKITGFLGLGKLVNNQPHFARRRPEFDDHFTYL